jgi:hypothetical protein
MVTHLHTVEQVIEELGGFDAVKELTNRNGQWTVPMWKSRNKFPPNTYVAMISALHAIGKTAPASLWGMKIPVEASAS